MAMTPEDVEHLAREANAEAMATQSLLVGLMLALQKAQTPPEVLETAFEFAANSATASAMAGQGTRVLDIIDQLQHIVVPAGRRGA